MVLDLPVELRLQVYKYLIDESVGSGHLGNISRLFLSCGTTCNEMKVHIAKAKSLLLTHRQWQDAHPDGAPFKIESSPSLSPAAGLMDGEISMPSSTLWFPNKPTLWDMFRPREESLTLCMAALQSILRQPWSTLTFSVHMLPSLQSLQHTMEMFWALFGNQNQASARTSWYINCNRLIFNYRGETEKHLDAADVWYEEGQVKWGVSGAIHRIRDERPFKAFWVRTMEDRRNGTLWTFGFDFVDGLKEIGEVQWKDGVWMHRQWDPMD
jgi:hypothetical protein